MSNATFLPQRSAIGEPTWEIAELYPNQGDWSEDDYLALDVNRLIEFSDGCLEVLPMPTTTHQLIATFLYRLLEAFASARGLGLPLVAPLKIRLWEEKYREPDVVFMLQEHRHRIHDDFWDVADFVIEVVGKHDRQRDLQVKRAEYAQAGIPEYWIVDPQHKTITVLTLVNKQYAEHGVFSIGDTASSVLLSGFSVSVADTFVAAKLPSSDTGI